jgi:hypothetical protein
MTAVSVPRIFLDTTVLKLAADRVIRGFRRQTTVRMGGQTVSLPVTQFRTVYRLPRAGSQQAADAALLPLLAQLAAMGRIELLLHLDTSLEFGRLPYTDTPRGRFFGAPITWVQSPKPWGRLVADGRKTMAEHQLDYLRSRRDQRFLDLQLAVGVKEGAANAGNQLLDAWHIFSAESAGATHFLTCDYKLIKHLRTHRRAKPNVSVVTPTTLLRDLLSTRQIGFWAMFRALGTQLWIRRRREPTAEEELANLGELLEKAGYYN